MKWGGFRVAVAVIVRITWSVPNSRTLLTAPRFSARMLWHVMTTSLSIRLSLLNASLSFLLYLHLRHHVSSPSSFLHVTASPQYVILAYRHWAGKAIINEGSPTWVRLSLASSRLGKQGLRIGWMLHPGQVSGVISPGNMPDPVLGSWDDEGDLLNRFMVIQSCH